MKQLTGKQQTDFVAKLLKNLEWLRSVENHDRMQEKSKKKIGIIADAMLMCIDFAEENGIKPIELLYYVAIQASTERVVHSNLNTLADVASALSIRDQVLRKRKR